MKYLLIMQLLFGRGDELSNWQCGARPVAPIGCTWDDAVCVCDNSGNCQWMFFCD